MQIVIDIDENIYHRFVKGFANEDDAHLIEQLFKNGTPLPEGHGRLIDADDLIQDIIDDSQSCIFNSECERIVHDKMVEFAVDRITEASTIIKADKETEND